MSLISDIFQHYREFLERIPHELQQEMLLTGGSAAFLLGSDRPFSNDLDFMAALQHREKLEQALKIQFEINEHKPVFHSLAGHLKIGMMSYDIILNSVIEPEESGGQFEFRITPKILAKKMAIKAGSNNSDIIYCVPKELLILMKLTAGRGKNLGKYDLYDVDCILKKQENPDRDFFLSLIREFDSGKRLSPILAAHLKKIDRDYGNPTAREIISWLTLS